MEIIALAVNQWQTFMLILSRVSGMLLVAPVLSNRGIPIPVRVGLALVISAVLFPIYAASTTTPPAPSHSLVGLIAAELAVGLVVGFAVALVFAAFQAAGGLVGLQAGLGLGGVFDPMTGSQTTAVDHLYVVLATLLFLAVDGHHLLILALGGTFASLPPGHAGALDPTRLPLVAWSSQALVAAVRIALPLLVALILADVVLAFLARAVPQINVLIVGLPLKLLVCIAALVAALPASLAAMQTQLAGIARQLGLLAGGV